VPLQNRVDPFGDIHAVPERGLFMGNRGIIHDPETKTLLEKQWAHKAWIICECEFKGNKREPMGRNGPDGKAGWTELFFLDEVTALAAGHRPCFRCRREQAEAFAAHYGAAFGTSNPTAAEIDERLHSERHPFDGVLVLRAIRYAARRRHGLLRRPGLCQARRRVAGVDLLGLHRRLGFL
jgi:hypothetical protein